MGDKQNTIKKLQASVKAVKFADKLDFEQVSNGSPKEYLKLYQYLFCEYSPAISAEVTGKHQIELSGKEEKPFMEGLYRLIRDMFDYVPKLTRDQFFSTSYSQVKATMAIEIIELVQKKLKTPPTAGSSSAPSALLSSTQNGQMNTTNTGSQSLATKTSRTNLKPEGGSENAASKPSAHHLPPKVSRPTSSSTSNELGSKLEGLMLRLAQVEKCCQEISRDQVQTKESRTFKDDEPQDGAVEQAKEDGETEKQQSNEYTKQMSEMARYSEFQISREEFEKLSSRVVTIERTLVNFELKQKELYKKFEEFESKQEQQQSVAN